MGLVYSVASFVFGLFRQEAASAGEKFKRMPGITLYDNQMSPCARRVRMTLLEKGLTFRKVEINLMKGEQFTTEYKHICPNKKVPAVSFVSVPGVEDCTLYESNVITEFLDSDIFPGPKLYPANSWERAQVKMWQDWELGLVDDFVPLVYANSISFVLQLLHSTEESFLASLPVETTPAKREYWSKVYDASVTSHAALEQHTVACYHNLMILEEALKNRQFLVGNSFTTADLSVLPRVLMFAGVGLPIPETHFPNILAYFDRLGNHPSLRNSQALSTVLIEKLMTSYADWVVKIGNWRAGRNLVRLDGSQYIRKALANPPQDLKDDAAWQKAVKDVPQDVVLLADCVCCPECWQIKLLMMEKRIEYRTHPLPCQEVVGRWAGSGGIIRIHHNQHEVVGIRAVLDYLDSSFAENGQKLFPEDPLSKARAQCWQAWDHTLGYMELAPLLEMKLVSKFLVDRYSCDLSQLYEFQEHPRYKFHTILLCFICGLINSGMFGDVLEEVEENHSEIITEAREALSHQKRHSDLLQDRLKHLDSELKVKQKTDYIVGTNLTVADIIIFCRLSFVWGLGVLDEKHYQAVDSWFEQLKESRPHFLSVSQQIADLFHKPAKSLHHGFTF